MLLLNYNDRNAFLRAIKMPVKCTATAGFYGEYYSTQQSKDRRWKQTSLQLVYCSRSQCTRTHAVSHITKVKCYFADYKSHNRVMLRIAISKECEPASI